MSSSPFFGIRVVENSRTLAGRLAGLMLADQGAEVIVIRPPDTDLSGRGSGPSKYLDRNKAVLSGGFAETFAKVPEVDVVISDSPITGRRAEQVFLDLPPVVAGDNTYCFPDDVPDEVLTATIGVFTDIDILAPLHGNACHYTAIPLCSVFAGVLGANAVAAALIDRTRHGHGRHLSVARLAAGLAAAGSIYLEVDGLPKHMNVDTLPPPPAEFLPIIQKCRSDEDVLLETIQAVSPLVATYKCKDDRKVFMCCFNRRLVKNLLVALGVWDEFLALGLVFHDGYDPQHLEHKGNNWALSGEISLKTTVKVRKLMADAFMTREAQEWEEVMGRAEVPLVMVRTYAEWRADPMTKASGLVDDVIVDWTGRTEEQLGRVAGVGSAKPYPPMHMATVVSSADQLPKKSHMYSFPAPRGQPPLPGAPPLSGYKVVDFSNVIAGPSAAKNLAELGCEVTKMDSMAPDHPPYVTAFCAAELNLGKKSILVDLRKDEGKAIKSEVISRSDVVLFNQTDVGMKKFGTDVETISKINPRAICLQTTAFKGNLPHPHDDFVGYDPCFQARCGIMTRYGSVKAPLFHGIATTDYLCGYLVSFAGLCALFKREFRGGGADHAHASLACAASLFQCSFQDEDVPETARGSSATGFTPNEGVFKCTDGSVVAFPEADVRSIVEAKSVSEALAFFASAGVVAGKVMTCKESKERHLDCPSGTINPLWLEKDGLRALVLEPTWLLTNGKQVPTLGAASRPGADRVEILKSLGRSDDDVVRLTESGVVGLTDWAHRHTGGETRPTTSA